MARVTRVSVGQRVGKAKADQPQAGRQYKCPKGAGMR